MPCSMTDCLFLHWCCSGSWVVLYAIEAVAIGHVLQQYPDDSEQAVRSRMVPLLV